MKLTSDRVLLKRIVPKSSSPIELPDEVKKREANRFDVVAVGPGRMADSGEVIPPPVSVGDVVMVDNVGPELVIDGVKYNIINPQNVLVIL